MQPDLSGLYAPHTETWPLDTLLLGWLALHPWQREQDLAFAAGCHRSTITRQLAALRARKLVAAVRCPQEAHPSHWSVLTAAGMRHLSRRWRLPEQTRARLWAAAEAQRQRLLPRLPLLGRLHEVIQYVVGTLPILSQKQGSQPHRLKWQCDRFPAPLQGRGAHQGRPGWPDARIRWNVEQEPRERQPSSRAQDAHEGCETVSCFQIDLLVDPGYRGFTQPLLASHLADWLILQSEERDSLDGTGTPLLIITPTASGRETWRHLLRLLCEHERRSTLAGAIVVWPPDHAAPPALSTWQALTQQAPSRLADLLQPSSPSRIETGVQKAVGGGKQGEANPRSGETASAGRRRSASLRLPSNLGWRHLLLLQDLAVQPLIHLEELACLLTLEADTLRHYLQDMGSLVEVVETVCGPRLRLSQRGLRLLGTLWFGEAGALLVERAGHVSSAQIRTLAGLYGFVAAVKEAAASLGHTLLWTEASPRVDGASVDRHGGRGALPCARFAYCLDLEQHQTVTVWVEWLAEEPVSRCIARIEMYQERSAHRFPQPEEGNQPGLLLCLLRDDSQERQVWQRLPAAWQETALPLFTTTIPLLEQQGPLAPIWQLHAQETRDRLASRVAWMTEGSFRKRRDEMMGKPDHMAPEGEGGPFALAHQGREVARGC